jgi:hypothetical protein
MIACGPDRSVESSPQVYARVGGALYLIVIVAGLFAVAWRTFLSRRTTMAFA